MTIRAGVKKKFAEQFKLTHFEQYQWFDITCLAEVYNEDLVAKLEIVTTGTVDTYTGIRVELHNRKTGVLDTKLFLFNDYFSFDQKDRADNRPDYKDSFHVWAHGGEFDWYIAKPSPKSIAKLMKCIEQYLLILTGQEWEVSDS
jgi:hypothetical protein